MFCTYPALNKTFFGQLKISSSNKTEWRVELNCLTNEESITCKVTSRKDGYSGKRGIAFTTTGNSAFVKSTHLKNVISSLETMLPRAVYRDKVECEYCDNTLNQFRENSLPLVWRVVHSRAPAFSAIEIRDPCGNVIATSHTLDCLSLPTDKQVADSSKVFACNTLIERAMLIRGVGGDWGIVKASWEGFSYSSYRELSCRGNLKVKLFKLNGEEKGFEKLNDSEWTLTWETMNCNFSVNLMSGQVILSEDIKEVPESLCLGLSIAVLFVLCQPRPPPNGNLYYTPTLRGILNLNKMNILRAAGLYTTLLPRWYHLYSKGSFYQVCRKYKHGYTCENHLQDKFNFDNIGWCDQAGRCGGCGDCYAPSCGSLD